MYTMRTLFAVLALTMIFGYLSEASTDCAEKYGITKAMVRARPPNVTQEQVHCLYDCFLHSVNWVHPNGSFNERSLHKENDTQRERAIEIVNDCVKSVTETANAARCSFAGCLLEKQLAKSYS